MGSSDAGGRSGFQLLDQLTVKPRATAARRQPTRSVGTSNPVTGKSTPRPGYAPSTVAHSETVLRRFYDLHRDAGSGPLLNPFPLDLGRRSGRAHAHHNPMGAWAPERTGRYRPTVPRRIPHSIQDKLSQLDAEQARKTTAVDLGMPSFGQIATRLSTQQPRECP